MGRGIQSLSGGHREQPPKSALLGILVTGGNATGQVLGVPTTPPSNSHKTTFLQVIKQKKKATLRFSSSTIPTLGYWLLAQHSWRCFRVLLFPSHLWNGRCAKVYFTCALFQIQCKSQKSSSTWQLLNLQLCKALEFYIYKHISCFLTFLGRDKSLGEWPGCTRTAQTVFPTCFLGIFKTL